MAIVKDLIVGDKSLLDLTYPVGSVYSSTNSIDPSDLFGGNLEIIRRYGISWS